MTEPILPPDQVSTDASSKAIGAGMFIFGGLGLIPALLILFILGGVSFYGLRFLWQLVTILFS